MILDNYLYSQLPGGCDNDTLWLETGGPRPLGEVLQQGVEDWQQEGRSLARA